MGKFLTILSIIALPIIVAVGAQLGTIITPIILIAFIVGFIILVTMDRINIRYYPYFIYAITLGLMWQTSMLGAHIVGSDMAGEFFSSNIISNEGVWHPSLDYGTQSSTSIVVGWFVPKFASLLHVNLIWIYKVVIPFIFSFTTVCLYIAYKKQIGEKKACLASLFFMIVPIASLEVAQIGKMMVAELFFSIMVMLLVVKLKWYWQLLILIATSVLTLLSHYTVGIALIAYIGGILIIRVLISLFKNWQLFKIKIVHIGVLTSVIILALSSGIAYYSIASNGVIMDVMKKVVPVYAVIVKKTFVPESNSPLPTEKVAKEPQTGVAPSVLLPIDKVTKKSTEGYMDKLNDQEVLIKTAIGLDFGQSSVEGKAFRIIQYITQLMIVVGCIWFLFNYKKYNFTAEFVAGIIASFILLACCIFVPEFSMIINATRFYQLALFFLAPIFIIGFDFWVKRKWAVASVMIVYFMFTSGLVYEALQLKVTDKVDVPYSAGLSAKRTAVYANYTQDDVNAVEWMINQKDQNMIVGDYNGCLLISAYVGLGRVREKGAWYNLTFDNVPQNAYIYLTSWNTEKQLYLDSIKDIRGGAGLRATKELPKLNYPVVYQSGNAVVLQNKQGVAVCQ